MDADMARPTPAERLLIQQRRHQAAQLYLKGETQFAIATALAVSQPTICSDLQAIRAAWLKSSLRDFDQHRAQELAKIDHLEVTYWQGWLRSREPRDGEPRDGNPKFLDGVQRCIERRCKLLGIDAPEAHVVAGPPFKVYTDGFNPDVA
jgi:hypothetical protein